MLPNRIVNADHCITDRKVKANRIVFESLCYCGVDSKRGRLLHMNTTTLPLRHSKNRSSWPLVLLVIPLALACFALSPQARGTCQQGCLPNENTVIGDDALISNSTGSANTAVGSSALSGNTSGDNNTAIGAGALFDNTDVNGFVGDNNTAIGFNALHTNTQGPENTAIGVNALFSNTTAEGNTAIGWEALASATAGSFNTATGWAALISNTGGSNTATGAEALLDNSTGFGNTATGAGALVLNTIGNNNTAIGAGALSNNIEGNDNAATGTGALAGFRTGSNNIALGTGAGGSLHTGDNDIHIGNAGISHESNTIRIGTQGTQTQTFIAGISEASVTGIPVVINGNGRLGVRPSSQRFKTEVKPMDKASEVILALKPVTFRYKKEIDPNRTPEFGLVAEDVEKVNPDLVARDDQGKPFTVRYQAVNAMLLNEFLKEHNEFLKEHRTVQEQGATIARLEKQVEVLTAGLQKVSAQLELSKPAPQTVKNND
jgi:hypothetical protein